MQPEVAANAFRANDMARHPSRSDAHALSDRLVEGLQLLRIEASVEQVGRLVEFIALLQKWNATYNLTAVRDPNDMVVVHVLDSLAILPLVDRFARGCLLDVGAGAGLPAIPLAILRPSLLVRTVDAVAKKIGFQLHARTALRLPNLEPRHTRVEQFAPSAPLALIVSRAYSELADMLTSIEHLADTGTTVLAMKAGEPVAEMARICVPWSVREVVPLDVPFLGAPRCAVLLGRAA